MANEKRKAAGKDINRYRKKKRKASENRNLNAAKKGKINMNCDQLEFPPKHTETERDSFKQVETQMIMPTPKTILDDAISRKSINSWESADPKIRT